MAERNQTDDRALRGNICELLGLFYQKGWVTGTGGGLCAAVDAHRVWMAPTAVHKERVRTSDLFLVDRDSGEILQPPRNQTLRLTECSSIFSMLLRKREAGSVLHSHALSAVLAADLSQDSDRVLFSRLEMLKGIRGVANSDAHAVPVIVNTPREAELVGQIEKVLDERDFHAAFCILVKDHGAYIWGEEIWEAKRHAEVYHFLFEAAVARTKS